MGNSKKGIMGESGRGGGGIGIGETSKNRKRKEGDRKGYRRYGKL